MTRQVLITGGAGFVGSSLGLGLAQRYPDWKIIALERKLRVLITSHNPALLDAVPDSDIGNVLCCYRDPQGHVWITPSGDHRTRTPSQTTEGTWLLAKRDHSRPVETRMASHHFLPGRRRLWSKICRGRARPTPPENNTKTLSVLGRKRG